MVFFKYLGNITQHSSLNDCFQEDSENKTANVFSLIFTGLYCSYGNISVITHYNYDDYKVKICALIISF